MAHIGYLLFVSCIGVALSTTLIPVTAPSTCMYNGKTYNEGSFRPSPCEYCQCHGGRAMCAIADCAPPACVDSVHHPDECCPVCPNGQNCDYKGVTIKHGETYHPDNYTICRCPDNPFSFGLGGPGPTAICVHRHVYPVHVAPVN